MISMHPCRMDGIRGGGASASTWPHPIMVEGDRRSWGIRWPGASWLGILIFVRRTTLPAQFTLEKSNGIPDKCPATWSPGKRGNPEESKVPSFDLFSPAWNFFGYLCSAFVGCSSNGKRLWADQEKCEKLKPWPAYYPQKSEENKRKIPWLAARIEVTRMSMSCKTHGHTHTHTNIPRLETPKSFSQVSQDGEFIPLRVPPTTSCAAD